MNEPVVDPAPTSREFFERLYDGAEDPWRFGADAYERARYDHLLEHVPAGRYTTAFEPGCSVGVLTRDLADRCRRVIATDISGAAVERARQRTADRPGVEVSRDELPAGLPTHAVDLVVLSEIGYYFTASELAALVGRIGALVAPGGRLVAVHWTGTSSDHVLHGREVHRILHAELRLAHRMSTEVGDPSTSGANANPHVEESSKGYVLDVWDAAR